MTFQLFLTKCLGAYINDATVSMSFTPVLIKNAVMFPNSSVEGYNSYCLLRRVTLRSAMSAMASLYFWSLSTATRDAIATGTLRSVSGSDICD